MRRLRFNPTVKVLSDEQINRMLSTPPEADSMFASRRSFLTKTATGAAVAGTALLAGSSARAQGKPKRTSAARPSPTTTASKLPDLRPGQNSMIFHEILADESAHVEILQALLNDTDNHLPVRPVPHFRNLLQPDLVSFVQAAAAFENTGTGTYSGALFAIQQTQEYFPVAAGLATVEARHAGYINALLNQPLVPDFFPVDSPISQSVALSHVDPFIADLNGGTVPSFDPNTPSNANNFAIEDFLLLLEMVETAFYQVNVAKFFA